MVHHEMHHDRAVANEEVIWDYCKQFVDFLQAHIHQKYDLRSSKKRSREIEQQEETTPQNTPTVLNKGKWKLKTDPPKVKASLNNECNKSKEHTK